VLEDGVVVGRIFQVKLAPEDEPWIWARGHVAPVILLISLAYSKRGVSGSWLFISRLWETDLRDINVAH
jgi:hypothetical protein